MINLAHFKGHAMGGFGGVLKNQSIGVASTAGKAYIHSAGFTDVPAVAWQNLPKQDDFLESMAAAAQGVHEYFNHGKNIVYINVMNNMSVDCDCDSHPADPKLKDMGILASTDPVALDQACLDLVFTHVAQPGDDEKPLIERINRQHGTSQLLAALSGEVPSLFVSQRNIFGFGVSNGGSGGIKIRGVGGSPTNSILMMVDGQPQFAGLYSHPVADFYETEYVDHVEVLRGPGSVLYGSNAMGGVINVITKHAQQDGVQTVLTSQYGSYNTWQSSLTNMVRKGKFSSMVSLGYDRTDGLQDHFDFTRQGLSQPFLPRDVSLRHCQPRPRPREHDEL